jgi:hypothetical protein
MARHFSSVIQALIGTARELEQCSDYQWGHMGCCNCGYLARQITHLRRDQIHSYAMQRCGDWTEQLNDYCPTSGLAMDTLISEMLAFGFDADELKHLERLSDRQVLEKLPAEDRFPRFNEKKDVIKYVKAWAQLLEEKCLDEITLPDIQLNRVEV